MAELDPRVESFLAALRSAFEQFPGLGIGDDPLHVSNNHVRDHIVAYCEGYLAGCTVTDREGIACSGYAWNGDAWELNEDACGPEPGGPMYAAGFGDAHIDCDTEWERGTNEDMAE